MKFKPSRPHLRISNSNNNNNNKMNQKSPSQEIDYAEEGRKLLVLYNLPESIYTNNQDPASPSSCVRRKRYAPFNPIFKHPTSGATLYVGNYMAAGNLQLLEQMDNCKRIVFCQNQDGKKVFEDDESFGYFDFPIGRWRTILANRKPETIFAFFKPLFQFLEDQLSQGNSVLVHCLAGAHRAGTTGIACLMHFTGMNPMEATLAAQQLRPAINPIGDFPLLLQLLEVGMEIEKGKQKTIKEGEEKDGSS